MKRRKNSAKKDYGFDAVFEVFDGIDNNCHKLIEYNTRTSYMINRKMKCYSI